MRTPTQERREISVRGIVQGVGFRPFIYALARRHGLAGLVRNDAAGVHIEAEGSPEELDLFLREVKEEAPPLAVVEAVDWRPLAVRREREFRIEESRKGVRRQALISPDVATCEDCLAELFDPADRRYRYPFTNCTNCGPRFTITRSVPYDRAMTTMTHFEMCPECQREYDNPSDRRFHAQPNACPVCGPRVRLLDRSGHELHVEPGDPILRTAWLLRGRAIVAVKGMGGYHLACDPFDAGAVRALRGRKARQDKPFGLMARDLTQVREFCRVGPEEEALLSSPARPIVLLERRDDDGVVEEVAPRQKTLGVMLAYTPLHHLLLHDAGIPLVMTSGNRSDEPIAYRDEEAFEQLGEIADYFLIHDRPIHMRTDDSVMRVAERETYPIRRSRGYAPRPLSVAESFGRHTLACGGELKNTFCVAKERRVFLSHHIGDLENYETLRSFREGVEHYCRLFDVQPELVAYDLHPEYLSTKYARELEEAGLPVVGVQHHHAHVASCLADNERPDEERVIGVALDGTGYGTDGAVWGGEFFEGSIRDGFVRRAHLEYAPLPGGSAAIRQPWRGAIAWLIGLYGEEEVSKLPLLVVREAGERNVGLISRLVEHGLNTPPTSSAGRLFDAAAALVGVPGSQCVTYEGQAAAELELAANGPAARGYPFRLWPEDEGWVVETREILAGVVEDLLAGREAGEISSRFHRTMAEVVVAGCERIREAGGVSVVALSGGTFQNLLLLEQVVELLTGKGFAVYRHRRAPTNDGGLALGQVVLADRVLRGKGT
ncbi:MAG: [NiFe] hydrogenase metallocenter assembly protein HypF [uncultured Rubrobacteraceae bacterium]|uniref:Carbamoyltransferase n=1 Tax=uncultured Rubrobacteraceae bacterium TaxID=349277 RepID=A0A6J4NRB3_9ACTN|nr:MAG: [NiFe] hydrogenase metallocenter assembly protein HypF [uncultured Rubrobacteraceae bacterium]